MTTSEQKLLALLARMVARLARQLEFEDTAKEIEMAYQETVAEAYSHQVTVQFERPAMALEEENIKSQPYHTGGGVYVLDVLGLDIPAGSFIWITEDETDSEGLRFLVGAYRDRDDDGHYKHMVPLVALAETVLAMASYLNVRTYQIPGTFYVKVGEYTGVTEFRFLPAAASAGYFGPALVDEESGEYLDLDAADGIFDMIGDTLSADGEATFTWES